MKLTLAKTIYYPPIIFSVTLLAGCSLFQDKEPPKVRAYLPTPHSEAVVKDEESTVELFDSGLFDAKLSATLGQGKDEVLVKTVGDANINEMPERLDKWLSYIDKKGGTVEVKPDPKEKSRFIGEIIELGIKIYETIYDNMLYSPGKQYNATVFYKGNGEITKVVFSKKK